MPTTSACWFYRHRWLTLAVWTAVLIVAIPIAPRALRLLAAGGFSSHDLEAQRAGQLLAERFGYNPATLYVVYTDPRGELLATDPRFQAQIEASLVEVRTLPEVDHVTSPEHSPRQVAPDGHAAYTVIALRTNPEEFRRALPAVERALQPTGLRTTLTGAPIFYSDIYDVTERDLQRAEMLSVPFAAVALLLVFGSLVAAAIPALVGGAAVVVTLAVMALLTQVTPLSIFSLNLTTMLGLGLGIDYSLFIVSRFREELAHGRSVADAVGWSVATAGRSVVYSGAAVFVGLLGLLLFDFQALRSLAIAGALVVVMCVLAALTLLPPLLGLLGPRIDALGVGRRSSAMARVMGHGSWVVEKASPPPMTNDPRARATRATTRPGFWAGLAQVVMDHPLATLVPVLALLVGLGLPFLRVEFGAPDASILPAHVQSRQGFDLLREHWGAGEVAPLLLVFQTTDGGSPLRPGHVGGLHEFLQRVQADPRVERVESIVSLDSRLTPAQYRLLYGADDPARIDDGLARAMAQSTVRADTVVARVTIRFGQTDERSKDLVRAIRATPLPAGFTLLVGGVTAGLVDYADRLYAQFPLAAAFVVAATYLVLLLTFRSLVLPLKAILMNTLSILASYGALVVIFQEGAFAGLLGFRPLGFVEASLPIIMFCVLFGLSMDYEVFLLSRVKEAHDAGADNRASVARGLERSGRIITSAAAIVVLVSLSFVAADIVLIKALGLGTAIAVFLDATVVRALLVPATMRLLGDWNWWAPGRLRHMLPAGDARAE
jgi:RND superfamily putative drug exporter